MSTQTQPDLHYADADHAARLVLERCKSPLGMQAASQKYPQVWARDVAITFLGAGLDRDPSALECLRVSIESLAAFQDEFGQIPVWVSTQNGQPWFNGALDATPWWVIACCRLVQWTGDHAWMAQRASHIAAALRWCRAQDIRHCGLMEGDDASDWADIMPNHGRMLFPNLVLAAALDLALQVLPGHDDAAIWTRQRARIAAAVQDRFWVRPENQYSDQDHHRTRALAAIRHRGLPHFLAWESMFEVGDRFEVPGNLLAILTGVATADQSHQILDAIDRLGINRPYPVQVVYPPVQPGDADWREYFKYRNMNLPHMYCNGGIWPWVGGLYVAALVKLGRQAEAERQLAALAGANRAGDRIQPAWRFSEWLHGVHGTASGGANQAWSAGLWLYARHAVATGTTPGFGSPLA